MITHPPTTTCQASVSLCFVLWLVISALCIALIVRAWRRRERHDIDVDNVISELLQALWVAQGEAYRWEMRARRLGLESASLSVLAETDLEVILEVLTR